MRQRPQSVLRAWFHALLGLPELQPIPIRIHIFGCLMVLAGVMSPSVVCAETIQLRDDATIEGDVLQVTDTDFIVRLSRDAVTTINGTPLPPVLKEGVAAPPFTATDLVGASHTVDAKQGKATVLHFWVSWCPFCRADAPEIAKLHEQFRERTDVRVLTVSLDKERAQLDQFMTEQKPAYPVIVNVDQTAHGLELAGLYQVSSFPVTYVIDGQGVIRHKILGSFAKQGMDLGALVSGLLPQASQAAAGSAPAVAEPAPHPAAMPAARLP